MTSTVGSPRRSSSAFVATVVPILTAAMRRSSSGAPARSRSMPATAASSYRAGSADSSFSVFSSPDGVRATTSVNVPPRSIQNSQARVMNGEITKRVRASSRRGAAHVAPITASFGIFP
jgi:hypothetical protein